MNVNNVIKTHRLLHKVEKNLNYLEIKNDYEKIYFEHACIQGLLENTTIRDYIDDDQIVNKLFGLLNTVDSIESDYIEYPLHTQKILTVMLNAGQK